MIITDLTRFSAVAATCMLFAIGANAEAVAKPPVELTKPPVELAKPPVELAKPSAEVAKNTTGKVCPEGDGPATNTTILQALFPGMNITHLSDANGYMALLDTNGDGFLDEDEMNSFALTNAVNASVFFRTTFKDFDLNGDKGINAEELNSTLNAITNVVYNGCAGLCNAVKAKLDSCNFFKVTDIRTANMSTVKDMKDQNTAAMLLTSCHLGSPDFDKFGKCVKESPCDGISKCVKKANQCVFGVCNRAQIATLLPHSGNVTTALATDDKAIKHERVVSRWKTAASLLLMGATMWLGLAALASGITAAAATAYAVGSVGSLIAAIALLFRRGKPVYLHD